jgi:hypothetical protein
MNPIQEYFYRIEEPERSLLLFIRKKILESDPENITETLSFGLPFLSTKRKRSAIYITAKSTSNTTSAFTMVID